MMGKQTIAVIQEKAVYCDISPYDPSEAYPEYPFKSRALSQADNPGYRAVRQAFGALGLDAARYGSPDWNPLRDIVPVGGTVVLKPNLVIDRHYGGGNLYSVITHPSIIRAVADYCRIALGGGGRIIVADASVEDCDFAHLVQVTGLDTIAEVYNGAGGRFEICDLRRYQSPASERSYAFKRTPLAGDPRGDVIFDLGDKSALYGKPGHFFGSDPATDETKANHHGDVHRYCISATVLSCDTLIAIPKLKVHKKVGVTLNLKGMVGINTNKNYLVHYTLGTPRTGGDEAPDLQTMGDKSVFHARSAIRRLFFKRHNPVLERLHDVFFHSAVYVALRELLRKAGLRQTPPVKAMYGGNWYGNDTCWRMVADIARIVVYGDVEGKICDMPQRRLFSVVDGIMGGECNGPLNPTEKPAGVIVSGTNLVAVDMICTRLMGFDPRRLPLFQWFLVGGGPKPSSGLDAIDVVSNVPVFRDCMVKEGSYLGFEPHPNWSGHLEMKGNERVAAAERASHIKERMRVCHVVTSLHTGGMERMVCNLMSGLRVQGVESLLCCTDEKGALYDGAQAVAKFCGHRKPGLLIFDWKLVRQIFRFVQDNKVTVMHAHNPVAHLHAVVASFFAGVPVVATWHGQGYLEKGRVLCLKRLLAARTKRVIIVSEDSKKVAIANGSVTEAKVAVIPNGVDTSLLTPRVAETGSPDSIRVRLGIPSDAIVIGSVGRLSPEKNYSLLVRAFASLSGKVDGCQVAQLSSQDQKDFSPLTTQQHNNTTIFLILVGDGPDRGVIEAEIARLNMKDRCFIAGMQGDVLPWLHAMDIFSLSSDTEGLSISLLEAGACGLPSVVTDAGGNREIVRNGVSGLVVPLNDEVALSEGFERLMRDAAMRLAMGVASRQIVEERYSLDSMVAGYLKVYEDARD
jgi:glycosyltransferase involved in cell wall biosynthesis/uncharacterized protein (DUF362 family)